MSDWRDVVKTIAPTLGGLLTAFGGPAGALAGAGLGAIATALGVPNNESAVSAALQAGLTPEQRAQLAQADLDYKLALVNAGVEEKKIDADVEKTYVLDVANAREHNANTVGILYLGLGVNLASYLCVVFILYGLYSLVQAAKLDAIDPGTLVAIAGLLGGIVQWIMQNASQANGFFFGSSPTARAQGSQLGASVTDTVKNLVKKKP